MPPGARLREKTMPLAELLPIAEHPARRCREAGALFIVNDRADLALARRAGGLQWARRTSRRSPCAASPRPRCRARGIHASIRPRHARRSPMARTTWRSAASSRPRPRPDSSSSGSELDPDRVRREVPVPLVGIGGISAENASTVLEAGVLDAVAVISAGMRRPRSRGRDSAPSREARAACVGPRESPRIVGGSASPPPAPGS